MSNKNLLQSYLLAIFVFFRFAPSNLVLAIHELDETHIGRFSFRTHESFFQVYALLLTVYT